MPWKKMLAYVTGEVNESLLARTEYLIEENRVLRNQIEKRILLTNPERRILAEKASRHSDHRMTLLTTREKSRRRQTTDDRRQMTDDR